MVVLLSSLTDESGKRLFSYRNLSSILKSENPQAAQNHCQEYQNYGGDFLALLSRKRKVDEKIKDTVEEILRHWPVMPVQEIAQEVNKKLGRRDINEQNIRSALEQISCLTLRKTIKKQLAKGEADYNENFLIDELLKLVPVCDSKNLAKITTLAEVDRPALAINSFAKKEHQRQMPESIFSSFTSDDDNDKQLARIWDSMRGWKLLAFVLYFHGVSLSVIGGWLSVHKSTVCRWLSDVSDWGKAFISKQKIVFSGKASVDEKWIKVGSCWWYLFAAVDCVSGYPLLVRVYPSNSRH